VAVTVENGGVSSNATVEGEEATGQSRSLQCSYQICRCFGAEKEKKGGERDLVLLGEPGKKLDEGKG